MANDPEHIVNWQRLDTRTTTSGRLQAADVAALAAAGVRHVINLALIDSPGALANEDALLAERGLRYTHIPVPFDAPEEAHYQAFRAAYLGQDEPVHVHCIANWRVSAFFYRLNRERGMAEEEARAMMARQWQPETYQGKDAPVWARFINQGDH
ncbi:MAG: hypothetical protein JF595_14300 [Sphingomonadales bacterium]|nr:hypothetical protein [Sphingomonadales bacterium]